MTVIGNNSANNSNSLANINLTGSKESVGSSGATSFLDVISMLSSSDLDLKDISKSNTLISNSEAGSEPSTLKLLQKFLDQGPVPLSVLGEVSNEPISEEAASQVLEFLSKEMKQQNSIANLSSGVLNSDNLTKNNDILRLVLGEVKKVFLPIDRRPEHNSIAQLDAVVSKEQIFSYGQKQSLEVSQALINTSLMKEATPKVVSIDLRPVIENIPIGYDEFKISKVFINTSEEATAADVKDIMGKLELIIRPNSAELEFKFDEVEPVSKVIDFDGKNIGSNNDLNIEIDKIQNSTLLVNITTENLRGSDSFPTKVNLKFSEPKPLSENLGINFSARQAFQFLNGDEAIDSNHAVIVSKSLGTNEKANLEPTIRLQMVKPLGDEEILSRQSFNFVSFEDLNESFADKLTAKLNSIVSGDFDNRQMLNMLRQTISKNEAVIKLDENIRLPMSEMLNAIRTKGRSRLMVSTADVISYREAINNQDKQIFDLQWLDSYGKSEANFDIKILDSKRELGLVGAKIDKIEVNLSSSNFVELPRLQVANSPLDVVSRQSALNFGSTPTPNSLNLYDVQFSSRLGMLLADQISKGSENFELQLEPESFGKVRVSVSLESSNVEVKMVAENSTAVMVLKGSESILQNIAEQNGLKLSEYSVDMNNNQNGEHSNRKGGTGENKENGTEVAKENKNKNTTPENEYKLNLLA
jgi:sporulation protein YlmC with PRC-barrel domain